MKNDLTLPFGKISDILPHVPETWRDRLFLTFDIDWACDAVLKDAIGMVESADVAATWFVTHDTPLLQALRDNPKFELGIHPNFNFLLNGDPCNGANAEEVIDRVLAVVPEARAVRSHSITQGSFLSRLFREKGLTHNCNLFIPQQVGMALLPWRHWDGLYMIPYCWEDDVHWLTEADHRPPAVAPPPGLGVFNFHPIHAFLNTEHMDRYERTRPLHQNPEALMAHRCRHTTGTRDLLQNLLVECGPGHIKGRKLF